MRLPKMNSQSALHYTILDDARSALLPFFKDLESRGFYLAGGTALALQIGHRDSVDFDFFCPHDFDSDELFDSITRTYIGHVLVKTYQEKNTLYVVVDDSVKLSFITYTSPLIAPVVRGDYFLLASLSDIACMKLSAVLGRSLQKDFVDLYFLLHRLNLPIVLQDFQKKYPTTDVLLCLKSLTYFDDVELEHIMFKEGNNVSFDEVKEFLTSISSNILKV
jgi:hypothetical protein